jgi:hypothetical protein
LEKLIAACRQTGAEVVLMEIPRGFMTDGASEPNASAFGGKTISAVGWR